MSIAHVTRSGNISIPKSWRDELGIMPNSSVIIEKKRHCIVIEPLKRGKDLFKEIDEEIARKKIKITREFAVKDDLYDIH